MTSIHPRPLERSRALTLRPTPGVRPVNTSNRFGWDYEAEARSLGAPLVPIIDVHSHVNGSRAAAVQKRVCDLYGIETIYSMTQFEQADAVKAIFGERIRFIAVPDWGAKENRRHALAEGYPDRVEQWHAKGARVAKLWAAPRSVDQGKELGDPALFRLDSPVRLAAAETAAGLGMAIMVHVADPDTWFATKYKDASVYGTKRQNYEPFERLLDRFRTTPFIAAHMAGSPEDLEFLSGLLDRHSNLHVDTSACKWQVRELSKHPREDLVAFFMRYRTRILFGSDIVTSDDHMSSATAAGGTKENEMQRKASSEGEAFDLYASRYWALRAMLETDWSGESPIADPDLAMVDPTKHNAMSAPKFVGRSLPQDLLGRFYHENAVALLPHQ